MIATVPRSAPRSVSCPSCGAVIRPPQTETDSGWYHDGGTMTIDRGCTCGAYLRIRAVAGEVRSAIRINTELPLPELDPFKEIDPETIVRLSKITREEKYIMSFALKNNGNSVALRQVINYASRNSYWSNLTPNARERRFFRAASRLYNRGLAYTQKDPKGIVFVIFSRERIAQSYFADEALRGAPPADDINLMRGTCKIQTTKKYDPLATPNSCSGLRLESLRYLQGATPMLEWTDRKRIDSFFEIYSDDVLQKIIALISPETGEVIGSQYSTRFNDTKKASLSLTKYDLAVQKSFQEHNRAVFVTLTTDPKKFKSNYEANRTFASSWNRFLSRLQKHLGYRPKYINAFEYTKRGLLHCHALIFVRYLVDQKHLSKMWDETGHGSIVHLYALHAVRRQEGGWTWKWFKRRPARCKTSNAVDYLGKYLKKSLLAMYDSYDKQAEIQSMYWALNKRFWTCSQSLLPTPEELSAATGIPIIPEDPDAKPQYIFLAVVHEDLAEDLVDRMVYHRGILSAHEEGVP